MVGLYFYLFGESFPYLIIKERYIWGFLLGKNVYFSLLYFFF